MEKYLWKRNNGSAGEPLEVSGRKTYNGNTVKSFCEVCQFDNIQTLAIGTCDECSEKMCSGCFKDHLKGRACRHHVMIDLDQVAASPPKQDADDMVKCPKHNVETIRFYCPQHEEVGCGDCMLVNHKTCTTEYIKDLSKNFKQSGRFKTMIDRLKKLSSDTKMIEKQIHEGKQRNTNTLANAIKHTRTFRLEVNEYIDEMKTEIVCKASEVEFRNETLLTELKNICSDIKELQRMLDADKVNTLFINTVKCKSVLPKIEQTIAQAKESVSTFVYDKQIQEATSMKMFLEKLVDTVQNIDTGKGFHQAGSVSKSSFSQGGKGRPKHDPTDLKGDRCVQKAGVVVGARVRYNNDGTVIDVLPSGRVKVKWDNGSLYSISYGVGTEHDEVSLIDM